MNFDAVNSGMENVAMDNVDCEFNKQQVDESMIEAFDYFMNNDAIMETSGESNETQTLNKISLERDQTIKRIKILDYIEENRKVSNEGNNEEMANVFLDDTYQSDVGSSMHSTYQSDLGSSMHSTYQSDIGSSMHSIGSSQHSDIDMFLNSETCYPVGNTGRKCHKAGCSKCAQGATKYCIAHGGGRRCIVEGCTKGARDKSFCAAHGGGKRCCVEGCIKSAVGGSSLCTGHGGGKRCQMAGCSKSAQSSTMYCVRHGGGRKCSVESCAKVARGRTNFCAGHADRMLCVIDGCVYKAMPEGGGLCKFHYSGSAFAHEDLIMNELDVTNRNWS
jgi:hypothetical protein